MKSRSQRKWTRSLIGCVIVGFTLVVALVAYDVPPRLTFLFPRSKAMHAREVIANVEDAGGHSKIEQEARIFFSCCASEDWQSPGVRSDDRRLAGLPAIQSLGDVFLYEAGFLRIRVYNDHFDVYFIYLHNPDMSPPTAFEPLAGNVGFFDINRWYDWTIQWKKTRPSGGERGSVSIPDGVMYREQSNEKKAELCVARDAGYGSISLNRFSSGFPGRA